MHHTLGVASRSRCKKHRGDIVCMALVNFLLIKIRMLFSKDFARGQQLFNRREPRCIVFAQTTWIVIKNMADLRTLLAHFQHFVDLLLVFHHAKAHFSVIDRKYTFTCHSVLVKRNRNCAQGLRSQHGGVQTGTVRTNHDHMFAALQTRLMEATGHMRHHLQHGRPVHALPNAVFFFTHGARAWALGCVGR